MTVSGGARVLRDLVSGAVVSVIAAAYCVSFAAFIFSGDLASGFSDGLYAILLGAGVSGAAIALGSSLRRAVAGPDTPVMAVFAVLAAAVLVSPDAPASLQGRIDLALALIAAATACTGLFLAGLGVLRCGAAFRFVPHSVVAGFLAGSGLLLIVGACKVATGDAVDLLRPASILAEAGDHLDKLTIAVGMAALAFLIRIRVRQFYVLPGVFCAAIFLTYGYLYLAGPQHATAVADGWFLQAAMEGGFGRIFELQGRLGLGAPALADHLAEIVAVAVITAMAVVLNTSGLEALWNREANLDREFRVTGLGNLVAGLLGGMAGNISLNRSMLNRECGGLGRLSGLIPAVACLALLGTGGGILTAAPTPALAGLLFFLGVSIAWNSLAWGDVRLNWPELALTMAITGLIVFVGYLEGLFVGIVGAALLFAYTYSRIEIVRREYTRRDRSSPVERPRPHARLLQERGGLIQGFDLRGYLFFATANRLVEKLRRRIQGDAGARFLLLDFTTVSGIDVSTALSFAKLRNACQESGATLLLSSPTPPVAAALAEIVDDVVVRRFPSSDQALEWAEEALLAAENASPVDAETFNDWLIVELGGRASSRAVLGYMQELTFQPGGRVVGQGEPSDSVDLFASGRVSVVLERPGGSPLRLRTMLGHTILGEMGFYRGTERAATVIAEEETRLYRLRRVDYDRMAAENPTAAAAFDRFIIRVLSDRMTYANAHAAALTDPFQQAGAQSHLPKTP